MEILKILKILFALLLKKYAQDKTSQESQMIHKNVPTIMHSQFTYNTLSFTPLNMCLCMKVVFELCPCLKIMFELRK